MKNKGLWVTIAILAAYTILRAQGTVPPLQFSVGPSTHASCTPVPSVTSFCFANDGAFQSINGGAWTPMSSGGGTVAWTQITGVPPLVNSFAGRSGVVTPAANDYSFSLISGTVPVPPAFGCSQLSLINSANPPFAVNGCK